VVVIRYTNIMARTSAIGIWNTTMVGGGIKDGE
jgi:hypothetical protein